MILYHKQSQEVNESYLIFVFSYINHAHELINSFSRHALNLESGEPFLYMLSGSNFLLHFRGLNKGRHKLSHFLNISH